MSETIDDIVREIRRSQNGNVHTISAKEAYALADRIEAAAKALEADRDNWRRQALDEDARANATHKDSLAVGDMAAMREAFEEMLAWYDELHDDVAAIDAAMEKARAALAKPPRNCDVGSVEEQYARFKKWCEGEFYKRPMNPLTGEPCKSCPCYSVSANGVDGCNYLRWAQMQYEKEGEA